MRGLARPDHVRLLHGYCPFCFKGCPGVSGSAWYHKQDRRIDEEQMRMPSGLPNLDLSSPGEPCQHSQMCRMTCLVCGKSMADGDEPKFEALVDLLDDLTSALQEHREQVATMPGLQMLTETLAKELKRDRDKALRKYGLAWIDRWERPVHRQCAKETPCQCVVPVCSDTCVTHKRRLPLTTQARVIRRAQPSQKMPAAAVEAERKPVAPPNVTIIPASNHKAGVSLTKATWLQKPSEIASTSSSYRAAPTAPPPSKKRKPPPAKPNLRLQAAAASCQKIERFASEQGKGRDCLDSKLQTILEGEDEVYDLDWHVANFDPWKHGDFWRGGQMWFRRPDGRVIPSFEGVRKFTKAGYLIPG